MADREQRPEGGVLEETRRETARPPLWKVLLHNDDYTTMEFVVETLETVFGRSPAEAFRVMLLVHRTGVGLAGAYPHEIAETKVALVHERARERGFPLRATMEEE
jgi:ATP-dependent Clp protease adaptor protein ClpS